jgi:hypothetical protein
MRICGRTEGVALGSRRNDVHRATYTLELGVWYATCNICGYRISDPVRRRTAAAYRSHIRDAVMIDLTVGTSVLPREGQGNSQKFTARMADGNR